MIMRSTQQEDMTILNVWVYTSNAKALSFIRVNVNRPTKYKILGNFNTEL